MPTYASTNSPSRQARKAQETVSKLYKRNLIYRNFSATRTSLHFPYPWLSILIQSSLEATLQHVLHTSSVCLPPAIISEGYLSVSCWYKAAEDKRNPWYRPRHLTEDQPVYLQLGAGRCMGIKEGAGRKVSQKNACNSLYPSMLGQLHLALSRPACSHRVAPGPGNSVVEQHGARELCLSASLGVSGPNCTLTFCNTW